MNDRVERIALAAVLEELRAIRKLLEGLHLERFEGGVRRDPILPPCSGCGGVGGFHGINCPARHDRKPEVLSMTPASALTVNGRDAQ